MTVPGNLDGLRRWRILVVEDEPDGQEIVAGLLQRHNVVTDRAYSAEEAIALLLQNKYSGAVIDLALPGMDGWGLLKIIRDSPDCADLPCVAVTAFHTSRVRQQALASGFNAYFPKPLDPEGFVRDLSSVMGPVN